VIFIFYSRKGILRFFVAVFITDELPNQAALLGVLQQLYINGIPIPSMQCLTSDECLEQP
jgi:hypothetical protein